MKTYLLAATAALALTPAVAHADAFDGAYGGVELGWETNRANLGDGFNYGVVAGYNKKVADQLVLGLEAKAALSTADRTYIDTPYEGEELKAGRSLGVAARVGVLATPQTLVYGKIGYENVRTKYEYETATVEIEDGFNTDALVLGAGVEYALNQNTSVRLGYDFTDGEEGYRRHAVKTGVAFHF
ncbi:MAG TPA: outer membrane beta-barrel protein [Pedomonas sp.]|uniref:outer membrane protein n=1 Tax=Pedomonas sp. TaxID=2976421 RepID=UPI002F3FAC63